MVLDFLSYQVLGVPKNMKKLLWLKTYVGMQGCAQDILSGGNFTTLNLPSTRTVYIRVHRSRMIALHVGKKEGVTSAERMMPRSQAPGQTVYMACMGMKLRMAG